MISIGEGVDPLYIIAVDVRAATENSVSLQLCTCSEPIARTAYLLDGPVPLTRRPLEYMGRAHLPSSKVEYIGRTIYSTAHRADGTGPFTRQANKSSYSRKNFGCTCSTLVWITEPTVENKQEMKPCTYSRYNQVVRGRMMIFVRWSMNGRWLIVTQAPKTRNWL